MIELANDHELLPSRRNPFGEPIDEPSMLAWNQVGVTDNSPRKWYRVGNLPPAGTTFSGIFAVKYPPMKSSSHSLEAV